MLRQLPTLGAFIDQAFAAAKRFPLVLLSAIVAAGAAIVSINHGGNDATSLRVLAPATLGLPLCFGLAVAAEFRWPGWRGQLGAGIVALAVLAAFYLDWPGWSDNVRGLRYVQLSVAFHLGAAVLPFVRANLPNAFWQYNRRLLQRFLLSAVFSGVVFGGLSLALAAVHELLGLDVPPEAYGRLWVTIAFVVNTWIFLTGVPPDLAALEQEHDFPKALKVLAQRILVPLVTLYVVILTLYLARVIISHDWPRGWIGYLVSGLSVTGILALLLVYPISDQPDERWVATFARGFWFALLPSIAMLWLAIEQRVRQYGVTEPRYFLIVMSAWLFGVALFYVIRRSRDMRIIPASLGLVAVVTFAGPWSAYGISERSQMGRLRTLLQNNDMLTNGKIRPATRPVATNDEREISATLQYLIDNRGKAPLVPLFAGTTLGLDTLVKAGESANNATPRVARALGLTYRRGEGSGRSLAYRATTSGVTTKVTGFDLLISLQNARPAPGDTGYWAGLVRNRGLVRVMRNQAVLVELPLDSLVATALRAQSLDVKARLPLYAEGTGAGGTARVRVTSMYGNDTTATGITSLNGDVLLRLRATPPR